MTTHVPGPSRPEAYGTPPHGRPDSIVTDIAQRLALVVIAALGILVLLPALVSAAGSHVIGVN